MGHSRARPCPCCGSIIRPIPKWDRLGNRVILLLLFCGLPALGCAFGFLVAAEGLVALLALLWVLYPWVTPYEVVEARGRLRACQVCGYDLRATSERCPECGTNVAVGRP